MEHLLVPRLLALAERAWSPDPAWAKEKDPVKSEKVHQEGLSVFFNTLGKKELPRLDFYNGGFGYRIPTPGAIIKDGNVVANIQLPGFAIRYTTDGTEPTKDSKVYDEPISEKGIVRLRAFDQRGREVLR
jgi:hexosaminidase